MPFGLQPVSVEMHQEDVHITVLAGQGDLDAVMAKLGSADLSLADSNGYTCLHAAVAYRQLHVVRWLLASGADANVTDADGDTPLHHAEVGKVELLLAHTSNH